MRSPVLLLPRHLIGALSFFGILSACGGGGSHGEEVIDASPPVVLAVYPAPDAVDIEPPTLVQGWFDDRLDAASVTETTFLLYDGTGQPVAGTVSHSDLYGCWFDDTASWCGYTVEFAPTAPLKSATRYTAVLMSGIQNTSGYPLASEYAWSFTTRP